MSLIHPSFQSNKILRRFCKTFQNHISSYENPSKFLKISNNDIKNSQAYFIKIEDIQNFHYSFPNNNIPNDKHFYIEFNLTFFSDDHEGQNQKLFFGNTYSTQKLPISFDNNFIINIDNNNNNNINIFFFNTENINFKIVIEIILISTPIDNDSMVLNREVIGWSLVNFFYNSSLNENLNSADIFKGSCRELLFHPEKTFDSQKFLTIENCKLNYYFQKNNSNNNNINIDSAKILVPVFYLFGNNPNKNYDVPGLLFRHIPNEININTVDKNIKISKFFELYLKNVEFEFYSNSLNSIYEIIINNYKNKNKNNNFNIINQYFICYVHNTYKPIINSENVEELPKNYLIIKGNSLLANENIITVDNYFLDEFGLCAIIVELYIEVKDNSLNKIFTLPVGLGIICPNNRALDNNFNIFDSIDVFTDEIKMFSNFENLIGIGNKLIKLNFGLSKNKEEIKENYKSQKIREMENDLNNNNIDNNNKENKNEDDKEIQMKKEEIEKLKENYNEIYEEKLEDVEDDHQNKKENELKNDFEKTNFIIDQNLQATNKEPDINNNINSLENKNIDNNDNKLIDNIERLDNANENIDSNENYFTQQKLKAESLKKPHLLNTNEMTNQLPTTQTDINNNIQNDYNQYQNFKQNQLNESQKSFDEIQKLRGPASQNINYSKPEFNSSGQIINDIHDDQKILYAPSLSNNIPSNEITSLVNQGIIELPNESNEPSKKSHYDKKDYEKSNESLLEYIYEKYSQHKNFGDIFQIHFISYKPVIIKLTNQTYKNIPDNIYFKFSFWDFEEFITETCTINKPIQTKNNIKQNIPLFIYKTNADLYKNLNDKEMKVTITYDPSIDENIDYKKYLNYLILKELFVQIYDSEKDMNFGYFRIPLKKFLRDGDRVNIFENFWLDVIDNKTFEKKGQIEISIKSDEIKTNSLFNINENNLKFKDFNTKNQFELYQENNNKKYISNNLRAKKKKIVSVAPMKYNKLVEKDKEITSKELTEKNQPLLKSKKSFNNTNNNYTLKNKFTLDSATSKKVRVLKHNDENKDKFNDLIKDEKEKILRDNEYYETLNYVNILKQKNKKKIIQKTIEENNKNTLNISLIQGQPHYFNYVINNISDSEQLYKIIISPVNNNNNNLKFKDKTVSLINDPEEYKYITILNKMKIPNDYQCISQDNCVILRPFESVPLLFKILSFNILTGYDDNVSNKYTIYIYNQNNICIYFMSINIIKVFPVIDFEFYYNVSSRKLSLIKFINPFKFNKNKTNILLNNYKFIYNGNLNSEIKIDSMSNEFYFKYNDLTDNIQNDNNSNATENININNNSNYEIDSKPIIFFYLDKYQTQLFSTYRFNINAYQTVNISSDMGIRSKNSLSLPMSKTPRTIRIFSSDPDTLYFEDKYNESIILVPNIKYEFEYILFPKKNELIEIAIHCIDLGTNEILEKWLIRSLPNKPFINQILKVDCRINSVTNVKFNFTNPLDNWSLIRFESSNDKIMKITQELLTFNANESKYVNLEVNPQKFIGRSNAYIFVSDPDEVFNNAISVEINYYA